jgi:hypothetical protein
MEVPRMNALAHSRWVFTICAAIAVLAGCGGGSGSVIGTNELPSAQHVVPLGSKVTVTYTVLHDGKPFQGADLWLRKYDEKTQQKGAYIRRGKTNAAGKVSWSGFNLNQGICLGFKATIKIKDGIKKVGSLDCWLPGNLPLKRTFHA